MRKPSNNGGSRPVIESLDPPAAIAGGDFELRGSGLAPAGEKRPSVRFGEVAGRLVVGGSNRVVVRVPEGATDGIIFLESDGQAAEPLPCSIGVPIAENLHPVANPAVDADGNIYTTRSGARGEKVPVSIFKIDPGFNVRPFATDIVNPTALIVDPNGTLLVSGRNDGAIYAVDPAGSVEVYAEGMGVATGIAMDEEKNLYVGDRTGTVFKISQDRQIFVFATLEPSISAYHLAMGPNGYLYVTGPTTSSFDSIHRISPNGDVEEFMRGFGRPQGLAFDRAGNLYVAASHHGRKGIFRIDSQQRMSQAVSGPGIVGLAFLPSRDMAVTTSNALYRIPTELWLRD